MSGCFPRECDHHCAKVCRQYVCTCDYESGPTSDPSRQRICCQWEWRLPNSRNKSVCDTKGDALTRYFGIARSFRDPHDPVRFTGVNHIPKFLHTDLSSLDFDYSNILKERELMLACKDTGPGYYQFSSIRPYNKTNEDGLGMPEGELKLMDRESDKGQSKRSLPGRTSIQSRSHGQMKYLD
ncbi:uncharacterized protein LOC129230539 [Uloborus diversus]|uniref:uncharacterized protein LOC129230539 n=1 Tax=Uloborus diversus TaxID=327109 RepID=UPI00240A6834|nr:uncharacterized protein LOC129230539 [Uloborus diversus]